METPVAPVASKTNMGNKGLVKHSQSARCAGWLLMLAAFSGCGPIHRTPYLRVSSTENRLLLSAVCPRRAKLPCPGFERMAASEYASLRYSNYQHTGSLPLDRYMRLRIVAPVLKKGATTPLETTSESLSGNHFQLTVRASKDLLGYETSIYDLRPAPGGGVIPVQVSSHLQPVAGTAEMAHSPTNYIPAESHARYFELVFQLRRGTADHDMVLLAASSRLELKEALERFTKDPDSVCRIRSAEAKCLLFPRFTAVNPEMKVFVMDREIDLALGKTLQEALGQYGISSPDKLIRKLRITRQENGGTYAVRFEKTKPQILDLPLTGGDRIWW